MSSSKCKVICAGAAGFALLLLATAVPAADSPWLYGIHFYGDPAASHVEAMSGGRGVYSLECVLTDSDVWWGAAWQRDNRFLHMKNNGHTIIARVQPQWDYNVPKEPNYPLADYLVKVAAAADTLKDVCHIWQIGNEMNIYQEWAGDVLTPAQYVAMFKQIRAAIKSVSSPLGEQIVLLGPVSPGPVAGGARHTDGNQYLAQMCALLTPADVDGFGLHSYAAPWFGVSDSRDDFAAGYLGQLCILDHYGFSDKPVYITEWNRGVNVSSAADEAVAAQFLSAALVDLDAWNQTPRGHRVATACWFIYAYDSGAWPQYSIEYLRTVNPAGPTNDLFDSYQYACTLNLPAAFPPVGGHEDRMVDAVPPGTNVARTATIVSDSGFSTAPQAIDGILSLTNRWGSDTTGPHWLRLDLGQERVLSGFKLHHFGSVGGNARYNLQCLMFQTGPTDAGPWTVQEAIYNEAGITSRTFNVPRKSRYVRLLIADPGYDGAARVPEFEVYAIKPGDFDASGAVDLADFAAFQTCYSGAGPQAGTACLWSHFDEDGDVDAADFAGFAAALDAE